jgi:hypothetical protein
LLGSAGKQGIKACASKSLSKTARAITQIGRSLTKGAKIVSSHMVVTSKRDTGESANERTI